MPHTTRSIASTLALPASLAAAALAVTISLSMAQGPAGAEANSVAPQGAAPQAAPPGAPQAVSPLSDSDARAVLAKLVGTWRITGTSFDSNGQKDSALSGTAAYGWTLGGNFLAGEQVLSNGSMWLHSIDYLGFTPGANLFQRSLLTDRDPSILGSKGSWDPQRMALTVATGNVAAPGGSSRRIQTTIDFSQASRVAWEIVYLAGTPGNEAPVGTVRMVMEQVAAAAPSVPGGVPGNPGAPGNPGNPGNPGAVPMTPTIPAGTAASPADVQAQIQGFLRQKMQMQQQIENLKKQVQDASGSMRQLTK